MEEPVIVREASIKYAPNQKPSWEKSKKALLKPLAPLEYDGAADAHSYYQFVTEGTDYVVSGHIHQWQRVFMLLYYLKGKAYDFYT